MSIEIVVARVYDDDAAAGHRVLVDRLWPRGLAKDAAQLDEWCKQVAPSTELRTWYAHDPDRFAEFRTRYLAELEAPERASAVADLAAVRARRLVLLTAVKDLQLSHAAVLAQHLRELRGRGASRRA